MNPAPPPEPPSERSKARRNTFGHHGRHRHHSPTRHLRKNEGLLKTEKGWAPTEEIEYVRDATAQHMVTSEVQKVLQNSLNGLARLEFLPENPYLYILRRVRRAEIRHALMGVAWGPTAAEMDKKQRVSMKWDHHDPSTGVDENEPIFTPTVPLKSLINQIIPGRATVPARDDESKGDLPPGRAPQSVFCVTGEESACYGAKHVMRLVEPATLQRLFMAMRKGPTTLLAVYDDLRTVGSGDEKGTVVTMRALVGPSIFFGRLLPALPVEGLTLNVDFIVKHNKREDAINGFAQHVMKELTEASKDKHVCVEGLFIEQPHDPSAEHKSNVKPIRWTLGLLRATRGSDSRFVSNIKAAVVKKKKVIELRCLYLLNVPEVKSAVTGAGEKWTEGASGLTGDVRRRRFVNVRKRFTFHWQKLDKSGKATGKEESFTRAGDEYLSLASGVFETEQEAQQYAALFSHPPVQSEIMHLERRRLRAAVVDAHSEGRPVEACVTQLLLECWKDGSAGSSLGGVGGDKKDKKENGRGGDANKTGGGAARTQVLLPHLRDVMHSLAHVLRDIMGKNNVLRQLLAELQRRHQAHLDAEEAKKSGQGTPKKKKKKKKKKGQTPSPKDKEGKKGDDDEEEKKEENDEEEKNDADEDKDPYVFLKDEIIRHFDVYRAELQSLVSRSVSSAMNEFGDLIVDKMTILADPASRRLLMANDNEIESTTKDLSALNSCCTALSLCVVADVLDIVTAPEKEFWRQQQSIELEEHRAAWDAEKHGMFAKYVAPELTPPAQEAEMAFARGQMVIDVQDEFKRASKSRQYPAALVRESIFLRYLVDTRMDKALEEIISHLLTHSIVPNPLPALVQRLQALAVRHELWREIDSDLMLAVERAGKLTRFDSASSALVPCFAYKSKDSKFRAFGSAPAVRFLRPSAIRELVLVQEAVMNNLGTGLNIEGAVMSRYNMMCGESVWRGSLMPHALQLFPIVVVRLHELYVVEGTCTCRKCTRKGGTCGPNSPPECMRKQAIGVFAQQVKEHVVKELYNPGRHLILELRIGGDDDDDSDPTTANRVRSQRQQHDGRGDFDFVEAQSVTPEMIVSKPKIVAEMLMEATEERAHILLDILVRVSDIRAKLKGTDAVHKGTLDDRYVHVIKSFALRYVNSGKQRGGMGSGGKRPAVHHFAPPEAAYRYRAVFAGEGQQNKCAEFLQGFADAGEGDPSSPDVHKEYSATLKKRMGSHAKAGEFLAAYKALASLTELASPTFAGDYAGNAHEVGKKLMEEPMRQATVSVIRMLGSLAQMLHQLQCYAALLARLLRKSAREKKGGSGRGRKRNTRKVDFKLVTTQLAEFDAAVRKSVASPEFVGLNGLKDSIDKKLLVAKEALEIAAEKDKQVAAADGKGAKDKEARKASAALKGKAADALSELCFILAYVSRTVARAVHANCPRVDQLFESALNY